MLYSTNRNAILRMVVWILFVCGPLVAEQEEATESEAVEAGEISLSPGFRPVNTNRRWLSSTIQRLEDGRLMIAADRNGVQFSSDGMATWSDPLPILTPQMREKHPGSLPTGGAALIATQSGNWVIAWRDPRKPDSLADYWDSRRIEPVRGASADVWVSVSRDQGQTWAQPQRILELPGGYPPKEIVETRNGTLLMPIQYHDRRPGRNVIVVARSTNQGASWDISPSKIDIGGAGAHDGALEPSLVELKDGRVWILFRTSKGRLWQSFSSDDGVTWAKPSATNIPASSSPLYIDRLSDGRLVLLWNTEKPSDGGNYRTRGSDPLYSRERASWYRAELSLALSADDGATWSRPMIVARHASRSGRVSYPYFFETDDGQLLVFANQGKLEASIRLR
jgi:sialidase-1